MIKKNGVNGLLIIAIIFIYGYLSTLFFSGEEINHQTGIDAKLDSLVLITSELSQLPKHDVDPFRSKLIPKKVVPKPQPKIVNIPKPKPTLPQFKIAGKIQLNDRWQLTIQHQNKFYYVQETDHVGQLEFAKISRDSIHIKYLDHMFVIRNEVQ